VPDYLVKRRAELQQQHAEQPMRDVSWAAMIESLQGEKIMWMDYPFEVYQLAAPRVERGERWTYSPDSVLVLSGGTKGRDLPADWRSYVDRFLDPPVRLCYGMSELSLAAMECSNGRYHISPWIIPLVLHPETSELLPRLGTQRGRAAFFDLLANDHWGGFVSGDWIELDYDTACGCGASTYHIGMDVERLTATRGGDDKISCTGSPEAHAEAMQFLLRY
jgi:hypothetical protein